MRRIRELITFVEHTHPSNTFFATVDETLKVLPEAYVQYQAYERALMTLDLDSWNQLRAKALAHFNDHRSGQIKQGFFNQLNEAFAYEYLTRRGFHKVRVLPETGRTQPDIQYIDRTITKYCEVKTIGISDALIRRRELSQGVSSSIYNELSPEFLNKLSSTISTAAVQLNAAGANGLTYLLVLFDDFTLEHYKNYRKQIAACIAAHSMPNVYIKIGIVGRKRIQKGLP